MWQQTAPKRVYNQSNSSWFSVRNLLFLHHYNFTEHLVLKIVYYFHETSVSLLIWQQTAPMSKCYINVSFFLRKFNDMSRVNYELL